jgi:alpha-beta hydrolase superfamily lysophospholipase
MSRAPEPVPPLGTVRQDWLRRAAARSPVRSGGSHEERPSNTARRLAKVAAALAIAFVCGELVATAAMVLSIRSDPAPLPESLAAAARERGGAQPIEVRTADGVSLRGDVLGDTTSRPVIVLAHGYRLDRRSLDPLATRLLGAGYAVVSFDFRGSGASDGYLTGGGAIEKRDVEAVVDHLMTMRRVAPGRIGLVAFSMGAVATIEAAARLPKVGAAVLIAPYASLEEAIDARTRRWLHVPAKPLLSPAIWSSGLLLGVDPAAVVPERHIAGLSPTPVLLVAGGSDWRAPEAVVRRLFAAAGEPRSIEVLPGLDHDGLASLPPELSDRVLAFLSKTPLGVRPRNKGR